MSSTLLHGTTMKQFRHGAETAIANPVLQEALDGATVRFTAARYRALEALPGAEALRDHFKAIRSATLANLAEHLATFERNATANGAQVHFAADGAEACQIVLDICQRHNAKRVTKGKSMATEEVKLNDALAAAGLVAVETDLGEWLIQQAGTPPSHIIAPAIHMTKAEAADLLSKVAGYAVDGESIPAMTAEARRLLREEFIRADVGVTGGNMAVAETGSVVLVMNEGNGRMVTSLPKVHIALIGIEKVAPDWDAAAVWLSLLARSATGQPMSIYTTVVSGPKRADDPDGPDEVHIVFLDNGRSKLIGTHYEEALQCIRCGACLNACPVYREAGGHAYGSPYSGPIGAIITPLLFGLENYPALPNASTLCGACKDVCPARIDIPRILLALRAEAVERGLSSPIENVAEGIAGFVLRNPGLFGAGTAVGRLVQLPLVKDGGIHLPGALNPAGERALPKLAAKSFHELWAAGIDEDGAK